MIKIKLKSGIICSAIAILMLFIASFYTADLISFKENAIEISATITDIDEYHEDGEVYYETYLAYVYNGEVYEVMLEEYFESKSKGDAVKLLMNSEDPSDARTPHISWAVPIMLFSFGSIFAIIGLNHLISAIKNKLFQMKIKIKGRVLNATIIDVKIVPNIYIDEENPYELICEYEDEKEKYIFVSEPSLYFYEELVGSYVTVYFIDEKKYYVDVESLDYLK